MRRQIAWIVAVMCLAVAGAAGQGQKGAPAKPAASAAATGNVDSSWKCGAPAPMNMIPVGDQPDHAYVIQQ